MKCLTELMSEHQVQRETQLTQMTIHEIMIDMEHRKHEVQ